MTRLLTTLFGILLGTTCWGQSLHFDLYAKADGLPTSGVYDLCQDGQGALWIATEGAGLSRFDGRTFRSYRAADGLPDASVRALYISNNNTLWLGLPESGLGRVIGDSIHLEPLPENTDQMHVRCMLENAAGELVVGTLGDGLYTVIDGVWNAMDTPPGLDANVRCAVQDVEGRSWWGTDHGVWCLDQNGWRYWGLEHGLPNPRVLCMLEAQGGVWAGTETGLVRIHHDREQSEPSASYASVRIRTLARDLAGEVWVGTKTQGVSHFIPGVTEATPNWLGTSQGLPDNRFRKIYTDCDGTLWFGTRIGGIAALSDRRFQHYTEQHGFPEESVTAVGVRGGTEVWFGTLSGDVYRWDGNRVEKIVHTSDEEDEEITCIRPQGANRVWIGTAHSGVLLWENESVTTTHPFSETGAVQDISVRSDRMLIAGKNLTIDHGFSWGDATRLSPLQELNASFFSANADLWVGTPGGLYHARWDEASSSYAALEGVPGTRNIAITSITQSREGHLWVGTEGSGVLLIAEDVAHSTLGTEFMENFVVHFVAEDAAGDLWVGTPDGLQHLILDEAGTGVVWSEVYDSDDGFVGVEVRRNAAAVDRNGTIWCGTTEGISKVTGDGYLPEYLPPEVSITSTQLNYAPVEWSAYQTSSETPEKACFTADQNQFSFGIASVSLTQPEKLRYQFKLDGAEQEWQPTTILPSVTYSSLDPGEYVLWARASLDGQQWSDPSNLLNFHIAPPFYATWTFRILSALVLLGLVTGFVRLRLQYLRREKRKLEIKVDERTREVREEQARSEKLLLNILPQETAEELKTHGATTAKHYDHVSVLFTDFKGFTQLSENLNSDLLVRTLDRYFRAFDLLTEKHHIEKIKTIGDAYMCAAGIPTPLEDHAIRMVEFAQDLRDSVLEINAENRRLELPAWDIRIGIHSGPVVAGVVGEKKFAYDIWGDTVNIAARMESSGAVNEINISSQTQSLIDHVYHTESRGAIAAKNKGDLEMYFVRDKRTETHESLHT